MRTTFFFGTMRLGMANALAFGLAMIFAVLLLLGLQSTTKPAHAATTFTVNSTGDENDLDFPGGTFDGSSDNKCDVSLAPTSQCTLRAAIQAANKRSGADTIAFNIPGSGVQTISPATELPGITKPVTINGYSQPGSSVNTATNGTNAVLKVELHGVSVNNYCYGLNVDANNVVIRGLVINNFEFCGSANSSSAPGIRLSGTGHRVEGNFIGTNADGTGSDRNARGVNLFNANDSTIGGTSLEDRNLLSGNVHSGVEVSISSGNTIENNIIGPDRNGGPLADSNAVLGGVVISSGTGNRILSNSIFSNGDLDLGIDLGTNGVTVNDGDDPNTSESDPDKDTGPNLLQNYPEITSATTFATFTTIGWKLDSTPSTRLKKMTFILQFFSSPSKDPSDFGEGKTFLGQVEVTTNRQGHAESDSASAFSPASKVPVGQFITATATNKKTGNTSEFSRARIVEEPAIGGGP